MLLFNGTNNEYNQIIDVLNQNAGQYITASYLNERAEEQYEYSSKSTQIYTLYFISALIILCLTVISNILLMIDKNIKEYAIHLLQGASLSNIILRISTYAMFIIALSDLFAYWFYDSFFGRAPINFNQILYLNIPVFIFIIIYPIARLNSKKVFKNLRGDFKWLN